MGKRAWSNDADNFRRQCTTLSQPRDKMQGLCASLCVSIRHEYLTSHVHHVDWYSSSPAVQIERCGESRYHFSSTNLCSDQEFFHRVAFFWDTTLRPGVIQSRPFRITYYHHLRWLIGPTFRYEGITFSRNVGIRIPRGTASSTSKLTELLKVSSGRKNKFSYLNLPSVCYPQKPTKYINFFF